MVNSDEERERHMAGRGVINGSSARVSGSYRNGRLDLGQDFGGTPHIRWSPPRSPKARGLPGAMACQPQRCGIQLLVLADRRWLTVAWHMLQTIKREKVDIGNHGSSPRASIACIPAEATCIFPMVLRVRYGACGQYLCISKQRQRRLGRVGAEAACQTPLRPDCSGRRPLGGSKPPGPGISSSGTPTEMATNSR
jgi:hypothetical protein